MEAVVKKIVINGKFYAQKVTGVQRYAREVLLELDKIIDDFDVELVLPENAQNVPDFKNIKKTTLKGDASILWEQIKLPIYIWRKKTIGLHLCHVAPILKPDIVCIHDANVVRNPHWFTKKLVFWYKLIHKNAALRAKKVLSVSDFSKNELQEIFKIPDNRIENIGSGWQHIERVSCDEDTLNRYKLEKKQFFFSLGTQAPHKNMKWILQYAKNHPDETFVLSGSFYSKVFKTEKLELPSNVRFLGYLSDSEVKTLMRDCKAFLFPSFYEGFGIPPLESLSLGTTTAVSNIPVMHELFEDAVHYIDPLNSNINLSEKLLEPVLEPNSVLKKYNWASVSKKILRIFETI